MTVESDVAGPNRRGENVFATSGLTIAKRRTKLTVVTHRHERVMNAALYFELVDAIAKIDGPADLEVVAERVAATPMQPLERRVLDRALRARAEALAIRQQVRGG